MSNGEEMSLVFALFFLPIFIVLLSQELALQCRNRIDLIQEAVPACLKDLFGVFEAQLPLHISEKLFRDTPFQRMGLLLSYASEEFFRRSGHDE